MARFVLITVLAIATFIGSWYSIQRSMAPSGAELANGAIFSIDPSYHYANASKDDIFVSSPEPGESVTNTILVAGYARGSWYSEAVFPVDVEDAQGTVIGSGQGKANSDWMTDDFVPFTAEVDLKSLYNGQALIILKKDNPSGQPSSDASLLFPVMIR